MESVILTLLLSAGSVFDLKKRRIPLLLIVLGALAAAGCLFYRGGADGKMPWYILSAIIPGGVVAVFSVITKQAVGMGDALMLIVAGLLTGAAQTWTLLVAACFIAAAAALVLLLVFKKGKNYELPFLPCLLAAHLVMLWN